MEIRGTLTEVAIVKELQSSKDWIMESNEGQYVLNALTSIVGPISSAFALTHTQEQMEDIFRVLVNGSLIVGFEISKTNADKSPKEVQTYSIQNYRKALRGRQTQLKLAIALQLSK